MKKIYSIVLLAAVILIGCTSTDDFDKPAPNADPQELQGIRAYIDDAPMSRAGVVTPLADYVGRSDFKGGDRVVFTEIRRSEAPISTFTYPGTGSYAGIVFQAGSEGGWARAENDGGPERVYWTDAVSDHTFIAYGIPQVATYDWKTYTFTQTTSEETVKKTYYIGSLGDPTLTAESDIIDYYLTPEEQATYTTTENDVTVYRNPKLENEDLLISYDEAMKAEPGGSVALVKFHHALSSVRVVVNISGFSSSSSAADNKSVVSNMRLLHQPTMYVWQQSDWGAQPLRASRPDVSFTDQQMINAAWNGLANIPAYDQRKDIRLWIPKPDGAGLNQSKTFTFYGITTPQPSDYISTLPSEKDPGFDKGKDYRNVELKFDVTYPNPMKPSVNVTKTYTATLSGVYFEAGYNTTINISLNHKNEQMTVGAEYENWQFVATPDIGQLKKNSTFLQDTERTNITIVGDDDATIDDATWLYELNGTIYDIYGHTGTEQSPYQISTAYQLLSFAYEVKNGRDFNGKFVRLDADITLQQTSDKTKEEMIATEDNADDISAADDALPWIGIGDATHAFNGTFLGGKRFIYRLTGSPLFYSLGANAKIEQLQVNTIAIGDASTAAVTGSGLYANSNAGLICACKVVGDVSLDGSTVGAFVGSNTGKIFASYHIGATTSTSTEETVTVGGLAGANSGVISSCYNAGKVSGKSGAATGGIVGSNSGTLNNNYFNSTLLTPSFTATGVTGKTTNEMTKQAFVTDINSGITTFRSANAGYDEHSYNYQPANYPKLN